MNRKLYYHNPLRIWLISKQQVTLRKHSFHFSCFQGSHHPFASVSQYALSHVQGSLFLASSLCLATDRTSFRRDLYDEHSHLFSCEKSYS
jgi:hypothetical protein